MSRDPWIVSWSLLALLVALAARPAGAQEIASRAVAVEGIGQDSADVVASEAYRAGGLHRFLLGGRYRQVWAASIRVPVLDLSRFAGGLTPKERGGGFQTRSLRFAAGDGREFRFRSLDKDPAQKLPKRLQTRLVQSLVRDQTSALHPGGALAAAAFAHAVGLPHPEPRLVLLPDDPRLGEFRAEFGGMLGTVEVHPEEGPDDTPGFAGFRKVIDTEELAPRLNASPDDQVDARAYLTARLLDMFLNDWDRHQGNWRWGTAAGGPARRWIPIAKDRDQAFAWYAGALLGMVRLGDPRLIPFTDRYRLKGLTSNGAELDQRLLAGLERAVWDSVARAMQGRLTDSVIAGALGRMPEPYQRLTAADIAAKLRHRRAGLPDVAAAYYARLARVVTVHGTDAPERLRVHHQDDGQVEITLERHTSPPVQPHYRRTFVAGETREVRVYLHGGDDTVTVGGTAASRVLVRIIAGKGEDTLPHTGAAGIRTYLAPGDSAWYPHDSLVEPGLDRRPWYAGPGGDRQPPPLDQGNRVAPAFATGYASGYGLTFRGEAALVRYGFRTRPYASRVSLGLAHATALGAWRAGLSADLVRESSPTFLRLGASASGLERPWFFGTGNETPRDAAPADAYRVSYRRYDVGAEVGRRGSDWLVAAGPRVGYARSEAAGLAVPALGSGSGDYGFASLQVRAELDHREVSAHPRRGFRLAADAAITPGIWDAPGAFGTLRVGAASYVGLPVPLSPVLAVRAGFERAWGPYPWFEAAGLGGEANLRGYDPGRFSGDAAAYGGAELRAPLFQFSLGLPGDLGLVALTDVGRVWTRGESSGRWHAAWGGGVSVSVVDPKATLSATLADGERTMLYVRGGFAF